MKNMWKNRFLILLMMLAAGLAGCNDDDDQEMSSFDISLATDPNLGDILVDENGMTLYFFSRDVDGNSACVGGCLDAWPVFHAEDPSLGAGLDDSDFGVIDRGDGTMQTTYQGWPLYYFAQDTQMGDVNGEAVNNVWWVAKPDYSLMISRQAVEEGGSAVNYMVDAEGNTLYIFTPDPPGESVCIDNCIANWPAFDPDDTELVLPSIFSAADFAMIDRPDQGEQLTYKSMPLYYFVNDSGRGDANGEGLNNVWFVQGIE